MNGIIYCRVSSKEQVEGTSLASQRQACEEYARAHRISIQRTFIEEGESAKFADRTQLAELLTFCRENQKQIDVLLVWKVDRFARNVADHFNIKSALLKYGVRVVSVTEPIDANPEGKLLETILAGFAQFDNDIRAVRTVQGMRRKIEEGIWPRRPPLGYAPPVRSGSKKTIPDQPKQPLFDQLRQIWREFASGTYTKAEIRRRMESLGIVAASGRPLSPQAIDRLFQNPFYAGILVDHRTGSQYRGQHQPMVTKETFERVQQLVRKRSRSRPHASVHPELPLRGVARCPGCRNTLSGGMARGRSKRYPFYYCHNRSCFRTTFAAAPVHAEFAAHLDRVSFRHSTSSRLSESVVLAAQCREDNCEARKAEVKTKLATVDRRLRQIIQMRAAELLTDDEFIKAKKAALDRRMSLEAALERRRYSDHELKAALEKIQPSLSQLGATWRRLEPLPRQRFNRMLFPVGFVIGEIGTAVSVRQRPCSGRGALGGKLLE